MINKWETLYKEYPELFKDRELPYTQTCMCWGIECNIGWYNIIRALCFTIKEALECCTFEVRFTQVKEKFGTLRIYYRAEDTDGNRMESDVEIEKLGEIAGAVRMAEYLSGITCESCGNPGETRGGSWIVTTCNECEEKRKKGTD